ncbi:hypothetical protein HDV62DRAFT_351265 [Trichoderma sp. SZMC 28011]
MVFLCSARPLPAGLNLVCLSLIDPAAALLPSRASVKAYQIRPSGLYATSRTSVMKWLCTIKALEGSISRLTGIMRLANTLWATILFLEVSGRRLPMARPIYTPTRVHQTFLLPIYRKLPVFKNMERSILGRWMLFATCRRRISAVLVSRYIFTWS